MKLFVGIDVSSEKLDVCFLTDDNQLSILSEISVANDIEGASFIRETILEFNNSYHFDQNCDWHGVNVHVQLPSFHVFS
ncbi:IS116/IS110/IS902 family transposase [Enterococcus faecium DO]|uniref:IS116/IS110/IS902 family transposase n=1 Tax=Enterococcus faecium (strain ATCC BAA-472 / TX0016 / DO) TaxID=333849 RepID=I3U394_ENTFD|nr:IS116/IS110/IS902 family transposase [Enterococcus faecium DO]